MAKAYANCTCATCGESFERIMYGSNRRDADSKAAWAAEGLYEPPPARLARLVAKIENPELRKMLELRLAWFAEFDYAKIADYYAYQAAPEEQRVFEALGLVLLDRDGLIMNGFANLLAEKWRRESGAPPTPPKRDEIRPEKSALADKWRKALL